MYRQPLDGVKIIDLSYYIAGPGTGKILADWGAEVIKVEPLGGEPGRTTGATLGAPIEDDCNPYFGIWNSNKRDIALNLKTAEGKEIMDKLLKDANVFVTSFRPGALKRLGLDYETVSQKFPHIVWASINGFGEQGPDCNKAGFDTVAYWARCGAMLDLTERDTSPVNPTLGFGDASTSCSLAGGIAAGLYQQAVTGKGCKVMVSLMSQALWTTAALVTTSQFGDTTYPKSRKSPASPLVNSYKTADGDWYFTSVFDDRQYPVYLEKIAHRKDLAQDPEYGTSEGACRHATFLTQVIANEFAANTSEEMSSRLLEADIAHEKLRHVRDTLQDPQALLNNYIVPAQHRNGSQTMCAQPPVKFDTIDVIHRYGTPRIGEDSRSILEHCGYSSEEIARLITSGVTLAAE